MYSQPLKVTEVPEHKQLSGEKMNVTLGELVAKDNGSRKHSCLLLMNLKTVLFNNDL